MIRPEKGRVRIGGGSRARRDGSGLDKSKVDGNEVRDDEVENKVQKLSKSKNLSKSKKMVGSDFPIPRARLVFTKLRQAFVKAPILHHIDAECHIRIKTDISGYGIGEILSQRTLKDLGQWRPGYFLLS